jgi:hypothetical protein
VSRQTEEGIMEQQYQWGIKVTMDYLDGQGNVLRTVSSIHEADNEQEARARYEGIADALARPDRAAPKYQRFTAVALLRRPIGKWTTRAHS